MTGKIAAIVIVLAALAAGAGVYYAQVHAFYRPAVFAPGAEVRLTPRGGGEPQPIPVADLQGIDADSSPLRFRACFATPLTAAELAAFEPYPRAEPLNAPGWFDCFDARAIGEALRSGGAAAFLAEREIARGVDRVVAILPDGRGFAWHQLNETFRD